MRESKFIIQNHEKWQKYEEGIRNETLGAEDMERAFVELNDDLAYARTFYKNRAVRLFLNNLLAPVYTRIYNVRKWNWKALQQFFVHDAPLMNYKARYFILISFVVVLLGFGIGFFSTRYNPEFAVSVLGEDYIRLTQENISKGDPLAIYKYQAPGDMFVHIATNNLIVGFYFFLFGALFCVGSIYLLLANGIMLGVFTYMFTSKGLTNEYILTVYQHGTLEILSMVVEGAAGIMMGAGFLFPGTKSRLRSIQDNAKKSILMFLVCIPIIILAAFIESYLTRFTELPSPLRLGVISLSLIFMLGYFIVLPWYKFRNGKEIFGKYDSLEPDEKGDPEPGRIYNIGKIVLFAFDYFKKNAGILLLISVISFTALYSVFSYVSGDSVSEDITYQYRKYQSQGSDMFDTENYLTSANARIRLIMFNFYASNYYFSTKISKAIVFTSFLALFGLLFLLFYFNRKYIAEASGFHLHIKKIIWVSFFMSFCQVVLNYLFGGYWWFSMMVFLPIQVLMAVTYFLQPNAGFLLSFSRGLGYAFTGFTRYLTYSFVSVILYLFLMLGVMLLVSAIINQTAQMHGGSIYSKSVMFFYARFNYFILPLCISMVLYIYFLGALSIVESRTGIALKNKIASFTFKKEVYGIETE